MKIGCFTICSRNYLAYALTLRDSLRKAAPDLDFRIFLADEPLENPAPADLEIVNLSELGAANIRDMAFRYNLVEFNTAIKPLCFEFMFDRAGFDAAIFLDPDIQVFAPMQQVHEALAGGASCVLTPHILSPLLDEGTPSDLDLMRSGTFNLGFAAFSNTDEARRFLSWWKDKLSQHCRIDLESGLFVDQRFVDFAPSFLERLTILRDPGYNVAYWNLANRPICKEAFGWTAGESPLVFFHFSGVVPADPHVFSKHQSRFSMTNIGDAAELVETYRALVAGNGHETWSAAAYAYGWFETREPLPGPMRQGPPADPLNPFRAANHAFWNAPSERVDQTKGTTITRLMIAIHDQRSDLREQFSLSTASGRQGFLAWFLLHGADEYRLSPASLEAALANAPLNSPRLARYLARLRLGLARLARRAAED
jgi:hypothetical protein